MSLGLKLFIALFLVMFVGLATFTLVNVKTQTQDLLEQVQLNALQTSNLIRVSTRYGMLKNRREDIHQMFLSFSQIPGFEVIRIYDKEGKIVFTTRPEERLSKASINSEVCQVCHDPSESFNVRAVKEHQRIITAPDGHRILALINPIKNETACFISACHPHPDKKLILGVLDVQMSLAAVDADVAHSRHQTILASIILVVSVLFITGFLIRALIRAPVRKLTESTKAIAQGNLDYTIPLHRKDEIGILADSFNQMIKQLKKSKRELEQYSRTLEDRARELEVQTERAIQADQLKSQFLANTSHELRTPLNSIIGFLGLILDGYSNDEKEQKEFIQNAHASAKHLLSLINDVLDIAKVEAGKMELELEEVDLKALFEEVNSLTRVQAEQKKLKLSFVCEDEFVPNVYADLNKLKQAMLNLIGNAIKFTDKGSVTIRTRVQKDKGNVLISVEDTGVGVPPEMQEKVFEKFRQADSSPTRKHGGTGLGLTITKNLVEMMGGKIKLESPGIGKGSRVSFTVPIYQKTEKEALQKKENPLVIKGDKGAPLVLIVEDDPVYARYLEKILQEDGFSTIWAPTADDSIYAAQNYHPEVITLDYSLPQKRGGLLKNGRDVIRELQKDEATKDIEIIVITGQDEDQVKKELSFEIITRMPKVLQKPIDEKTLMEKIQSFFDREERKRLNILVADDDPLVRKFVTKVLEPDRYVIHEATNGQEALDFISKNPDKVDLLLLDLMMPEKSGIDVIKELKLEREAPHLPIVIITNYLEAYKKQDQELLSRKTVLEILTKDELNKNPDTLRKKIAQFKRRKKEVLV